MKSDDAESRDAIVNEPERNWRPAAEFENRGVRREGCSWPTEPGVGRMADGIPNRPHRLKGLGNAIVPQVASEILKNLVMANIKAEPSAPETDSK